MRVALLHEGEIVASIPLRIVRMGEEQLRLFGTNHKSVTHSAWMLLDDEGDMVRREEYEPATLRAGDVFSLRLHLAFS